MSEGTNQFYGLGCAFAKEAWAPAPIKLRGLATVWAPDPLSEAGQDFTSDIVVSDICQT